MTRLRTVSLVSLLVLLPLAVPALAERSAGSRVCRFADERIGESSGLASSTDGRVLWTHNDSGDTPRFFGVDPRSCATVASYVLDLPEVTVPGAGTATSFDWEDMARSEAADGTPLLLFADTGDNYQVRAAGVTVYEVAEPTARVDDPQVERPVTVRGVHQLLYPSGPHDAEALLALPDGRLVVVTKDRDTAGAYTGRSEVYATAGRPGTAPEVLGKVADLDVRTLPGADPTQLDTLAVTGGDASRDGSRLVVRTYTTAYEFALRAGDLARAFATPPRVLPLLATKQGEAVTYTANGRELRTSSEGSGTSADPASGVVDAYRLPRRAS